LLAYLLVTPAQYSNQGQCYRIPTTRLFVCIGLNGKGRCRGGDRLTVTSRWLLDAWRARLDIIGRAAYDR